jgi:hypothetical protein
VACPDHTSPVWLPSVSVNVTRTMNWLTPYSADCDLLGNEHNRAMGRVRRKRARSRVGAAESVRAGHRDLRQPAQPGSSRSAVSPRGAWRSSQPATSSRARGHTSGSDPDCTVRPWLRGEPRVADLRRQHRSRVRSSR